MRLLPVCVVAVLSGFSTGGFAQSLPDLAVTGTAVQALVDEADAAGAEAQYRALIDKDAKLFPRPAVLKGNIDFWRRVFGEYSANQSVIHDIRNPARIYAVLDFQADAETLPTVQLKSLQNEQENSTRARLAVLLKQTAQLAASPDAMNSDQRRMAALFSGDEKSLAEAAENIRSQRGLKERTKEAVAISGRYLPEMERVFVEAGLPRLLTRLPFVESSFNINAYSKVAAAGLWQFMPSSAKFYMRHDRIADERRDPWTSTRAAAGHLKDDFDHLGSWPLALTAYNYGRGGVARALKESNSSTLDELLVRFNGPRFGFASRNFYAEFVAATDVERDWKKYFGEVQRRPVAQFETVTVERFTPYKTLMQAAKVEPELFRELNPSYHDSVLAGQLYVPAGDRIRLPSGQASVFKTAYAQLAASETFDQQRRTQFGYKVRSGDTLSGIAARYGVSMETLSRMNDLKKNRIHAGRTLQIPDGGAAVQVAEAESAKPSATAPSRSKPKSKSAKRVHKVASGQTLSEIAARYDVSVQQIIAANRLSKSGLIKTGMKLTIPR